ncbi:TerB family tellurite resistance protein [Mesorhizobium marinum]|uniref:TerB family tellurite resistance protein n=1 Tax=Mesorhizobium marinum TaxID=3228790 RepID=A0ABV3QVU7_9HYPH
MARGLLAQIRDLFEGDPGVRKVADDPVLSAELLLLFRMILADGQVSDSEMAVFRRICRDSFGIGEGSIQGVVDYLNDFGYETNGAQALAMFRDLDEDRRRQLASHMAEIAKADRELAENEVRLLRRTLDVLGISPVDLVKPTRE